ncbi:MAG: PDZ domain-containing protein [Armatimonadetes bacterium]|nr:PDZ domain-containing protein [Armatimonadota bacterium]
MKQTVSAPIALIAIALCAGLAFVLFSQPKPETIGPEDVFVLPFAPTVEEAEQNSLRKGTFPLGVSVIFPPLPLDRSAGTRIAMVAPGSPAATGGLKPGDLVVSYNGRKITHPFTLSAAIGMAEPNKPIEVVIERAGEEQTLVVSGVKRVQAKEELF